MTDLSYLVLDTSPGSLFKTSVLVTGEREAVVVDAGFTRADGHRIAAAVLDSGRTLTTVLVTAGDPDFYFGAEVLADAFPDARFLAPADVIAHVTESYRGKLAAWAHLGANLPTRLVELEPFEGTVQLEGATLELRRADGLADRGWYVVEPERRALVGGVLLFDGLHVWTADSPTPERRAAWLTALDDLEALDPTFVVAGHRVADSPTDASAIRHTRDYLRRFEEVVASSPDAAQAEARLLESYPHAGLELAASLGTKVAKGEMTWG
ncbi:MAG: MBL fold metallo-hydrolase [Cellulomonas iranensis]|uniref:MBL fold metallo-hydrolase n=1 Tax=Cellulomonas iranensis TaxID=76862 RepID=UPI001B0E12CC|nr:MBL fold metallo-hydrolase [Cellulomonas iranensis]MBO9567674.1 MBL fold metallo-hydrolase [Cellulomonas iranensis]